MKIFRIITIFALGFIGGLIVSQTVVPVKAEVAGMGSYDLQYDWDFRNAVQSIIEDCTVDGDEISCQKIQCRI